MKNEEVPTTLSELKYGNCRGKSGNRGIRRRSMIRFEFGMAGELMGQNIGGHHAQQVHNRQHAVNLSTAEPTSVNNGRRCGQGHGGRKRIGYIDPFGNGAMGAQQLIAVMIIHFCAHDCLGCHTGKRQQTGCLVNIEHGPSDLKFFLTVLAVKRHPRSHQSLVSPKHTLGKDHFFRQQNRGL